VNEYLADTDRDLSLEELIHKNLRIKSGQQAKVFTQVYMGGVVKPREMEELVEKFGRIDTVRTVARSLWRLMISHRMNTCI
jgi:hypothetical protein